MTFPSLLADVSEAVSREDYAALRTPFEHAVKNHGERRAPEIHPRHYKDRYVAEHGDVLFVWREGWHAPRSATAEIIYGETVMEIRYSDSTPDSWTAVTEPGEETIRDILDALPDAATEKPVPPPHR